MAVNQTRVFVDGESVVYVTKSRKPLPAVVRFVGFLGTSEELVGIELVGANAKDGEHDGFCAEFGARGFTCGEKSGVYVPSTSQNIVKQDDISLTQRLSLSKIGSSLEELMETSVLRGKAQMLRTCDTLRCHRSCARWVRRWVRERGRYLFFDKDDPFSHGQEQPPPDVFVDPEPEGGPELRRVSSVSGSYAGPHLHEIRNGIVTPAEAGEVLDYAETHLATIHADYLLPLVWTALGVFARQKSLVRVAIPTGGQVVTLGDTHGHLKDVVHVFRTFGRPSPNNVYLFNGDICDRGDTADRGGQQAVTIWAVVLSFALAYPGAVFINRGNHEDWYNNSLAGPYGEAGFHAEIHQKFPTELDQTSLKNAFCQLFMNLPIAHVVGETVVVLHGGLCRAGYQNERRWAKPVSLAEVEAVERRRQIPCDVETREDAILYDAMWSDPHEGNGVLDNSRGGDTRLFGGDVTENMCQREGVQLLVRSHDWPKGNFPHGYEWVQCSHGSNLHRLEGQKSLTLTVFTASNYCGVADNCGGAVIFRSPSGSGRAETLEVVDWSPEQALATWKSVQDVRSPSPPPAEGLGLVVAREDLMWQLKKLIVEYKHELFAEFISEDAERDFHVTVSTWKRICSLILGDMPWDALLAGGSGYDANTVAHVAFSDENDEYVCYTDFLARYQICFNNKMGRHAGFRQRIASALFESLLLDDKPLREMLVSVDPNGDGQISAVEMQKVLSRIIPRITKQQAWTMLRTMSSTPMPVSVYTILNSLQLRFSATHCKPAPPDAAWIPGFLPVIAHEILDLEERVVPGGSVGELLADYFTMSDTNSDGYLEFDELTEALSRLPCCASLQQEELTKLVEYCDYLGTGRINMLEFLHDFSVEARGEMAVHFQEDLLEGINRVLYFIYRGVVVQGLELMCGATTRCTPDEFKMVLCATNASIKLLTPYQIDLLIDTLSLDEDERFDYSDYFGSFEIVDTARDVCEIDTTD